MKNKIKLNSLLTKSNKFNYAQLLTNDNVMLTVRSDIGISKELVIKNSNEFTKVIDLYNNKIIKYSTLLFILNKFNRIDGLKSDYSYLNVLVELGWESGILLDRNKKLKKLSFTNR